MRFQHGRSDPLTVLYSRSTVVRPPFDRVFFNGNTALSQLRATVWKFFYDAYTVCVILLAKCSAMHYVAMYILILVLKERFNYSEFSPPK